METKITSLMNGKLVIITPENYEKTTVPLFCPVCEFPIKTSDDGISYRKYQCCSKCENRWLNSLTKEINVPGDKEDSIQWKEYIEERALLSKPLFMIK